MSLEPSSIESPVNAAMLRLLFDVGMVICPVLGYVAQAKEISTKRSADGFAVHVSLILLISNGLRIAYRFGESYAGALLLQAIVMVSVQLYLVVTVIKVRALESAVGTPTASSRTPVGASVPTIPPPITTTLSLPLLPSISQFLMGDLGQGLRTAGMRSPSQFVGRYCSILVLVCVFALLLFSMSPFFVRVFGFASLGVEAMLLMPQILLNHSRGSTEGITRVLLVTWIGGDAIKMVYFAATHQPAPFVICGAFQLCCDVVLMHQVARHECLNVKQPYASVGSQEDVSEQV